MSLTVMKGSVICDIMQTCLCNMLQFFTAAKMKISGDFFFRFFLVLLKTWIVGTC